MDKEGKVRHAEAEVGDEGRGSGPECAPKVLERVGTVHQGL